MADIGQPAGQSAGSGLADLFGNVNRPALNSFVATSQARNGLVSAQTQDALIKAQQAQESQDAYTRLPQELVDANPGMKQSDALLTRDILVHLAGGDPVNAGKFVAQMKLMYGNPAEQTAGQQGFEGKIAPPVATPANFQAPAAPPGGAALGPIQQSPQGAAATADTESQTALHNAQATAGGFSPRGQVPKLDPVQSAEVAEFIRQNPSAAGNLRGLIAGGAGPDIIHAFLHPEGSPTTPANGITPAPGVSLAEQAAIRKDFASGTGAKQTTSLNTMVQHSQLFDAIADQLGNGNFTPTNYINQLWQRTFGSPVPTNLQAAGDFLGREAVRATVNSGAGTGAERELQVNANSSPDQLHGAAQTLRSLAAGQLHSLDLRAQRGGVDIAQLLGPAAQATFGRHPAAVSAPHEAPDGGSTGSTGLPSYPDEQSALAAGHKAGDRVIIGGVTGTLQ